MFIRLLDISLVNFISRSNIIAAIILAGCGFAACLLAPKIGKKFGVDNNGKKNNLAVMVKITGLVLMLIGIALVGIESVMGIISNT